jgi:hypothetical protein
VTAVGLLTRGMITPASSGGSGTPTTIFVIVPVGRLRGRLRAAVGRLRGRVGRA